MNHGNLRLQDFGIISEDAFAILEAVPMHTSNLEEARSALMMGLESCGGASVTG